MSQRHWKQVPADELQRIVSAHDARMNRIGTHWDDCWQSHHDCALVQIAALTEELARLKDEHDPTPYCVGCGARTANQCDCGPIADND